MIKNKISYKVAGGSFQTKYEAKVGISLAEISSHTVIRHRFSIDDNEDDGIGNDMIISQDLCRALGIIVEYDDCIIRLTSGITSMREDSFFPNCKGQVLPIKQFNQMIAQSQEPKVTAKATERIV